VSVPVRNGVVEDLTHSPRHGDEDRRAEHGQDPRQGDRPPDTGHQPLESATERLHG
jgi:hypothetical protein